MPPRIKKPCRHSGCAALTIDTTGYCHKHKPEHASDCWKRYKPGQSRHERGYGRKWDLIRPRILMRDGYLCQDHKRRNIGAAATHVDHIIPKALGGTDDDDNLESLCASCHWKKTATERIK